jgi:RND family efflux transporter MFP subunit
MPMLLATAILTGCGGDEPPPEREVVRPVKIITFGDTGGRRSFQYPGQVYANQTVELAFEVTGKLEELQIKKGQAVRAGDLLARLDQRDFVNSLRQAEAAQAEAIATLERYEQAAKTRAVSPQQVDEARARARIAEAEVRIRAKALEDSTLTADFEGVVADRFVDNFQNVVAKDPVLLMQDVSVLEIRVNVPERDVANPSDTGDGRLTASFDALPDREFSLQVKEFVTEADPVTQTYAVTLMMPNPEGSGLLPGMTATVTWEPEARDGASLITVPAAAVVGQAGRRPSVWIIDPEQMTASRREVEVGSIVAGDQIQILSGLEKGERLASAGAHHLTAGMKVREYRQ